MDLYALGLTLSEVAALLTLLFVLRSLIRNQHCKTSVTAREVMMSINAMSKNEAFEYLRAELQVLNSILGELIAVFSKTFIDQWEQEGRPEYRPQTVVTLPTNSQKWPLSGYRRGIPRTDSALDPSTPWRIHPRPKSETNMSNSDPDPSACNLDKKRNLKGIQ